MVEEKKTKSKEKRFKCKYKIYTYKKSIFTICKYKIIKVTVLIRSHYNPLIVIIINCQTVNVLLATQSSYGLGAEKRKYYSNFAFHLIAFKRLRVIFHLIN